MNFTTAEYMYYHSLNTGEEAGQNTVNSMRFIFLTDTQNGAGACPFPNNCPFTWGIRAQSNACLLGPTRVHNQNGISISSAIFSQMTVEFPYTLQWDAPSPSKLPLPMGDLDSDLIHGSLGTPESNCCTLSTNTVCKKRREMSQYSDKSSDK